MLHALTSAVDSIDVDTDTPSLREIYLAAVSERGLGRPLEPPADENPAAVTGP